MEFALIFEALEWALVAMVYLVVGNAYGAFANALYRDNRDNNELTRRRRMLRALFFPLNYSGWSDRRNDSNRTLFRYWESWLVDYRTLVTFLWPLSVCTQVLVVAPILLSVGSGLQRFVEKLGKVLDSGIQKVRTLSIVRADSPIYALHAEMNRLSKHRDGLVSRRRVLSSQLQQLRSLYGEWKEHCEMSASGVFGDVNKKALAQVKSRIEALLGLMEENNALLEEVKRHYQVALHAKKAMALHQRTSALLGEVAAQNNRTARTHAIDVLRACSDISERVARLNMAIHDEVDSGVSAEGLAMHMGEHYENERQIHAVEKRILQTGS